MATVLRCIDYDRRSVVLTDRVWEDHIRPRHPETWHGLRAIETTLISPDQVNHDLMHADREVFYRKGVLPPPDKQDYLKAVVQFRYTSGGEWIGDVRTAFAVDEIDPEERNKWTANR
jgi:hypothetical protein